MLDTKNRWLDASLIGALLSGSLIAGWPGANCEVSLITAMSLRNLSVTPSLSR